MLSAEEARGGQKRVHGGDAVIPKPDFHSLRPVRILLLEDDPDCVALVRRSVQAVRWTELSLDTVGTLGAALERLGEVPCDMVIVDLNVPDSSGLQTLQAVVAATDQLVIVLTALDEPGLRERAIAAGAYDFVQKGQLGDSALGSLVRLAALHADSLRRMRERESRLAAVVNAEPECVKLIDRQGRLIEMNPAGIRMIEAQGVEQVRGRCVFDLVASEHRDSFRALTERVAQGTEEGLEFEIIGLKGSRRWLETRAVPLLDEASGETLVLGITRDITERKRSAQALKESEERFRSLTGLSSDWYWESDTDFRMTFVSGELKDKTGLDTAAFVGKRSWDQPALNLSEADWDEYRARLKRHEPFRDFELERPVGEGRTVWLSITGEPVFDALGRFSGYRGLGRDITERKRAERRLRMEHSVTRCLAEADATAPALVGVLRAVCEAEGWECGRYFGLDEAGDSMRLQHAWHISSAQFEDFVALTGRLRFARGAGLVGRVWETCEPIWAPDLRSDSRVIDSTAFDRHPLIRSDFEFPVISQGCTVGVISVASREPRQPDERLMQAVRVIGSQVGQFVARKAAEAERQAAEQAIRENEARFRSLTELSSDWYWEQDAELRFVQTGGVKEERGGISPAVHIGKRRWDLPGTDIVNQSWDEHRAVLEARKPFRDLLLRRQDGAGQYHYVSVAGEPIFDARRRFCGYRGVAKDVTGPMREERLLALEHAVTRRLAEARSVSQALASVMQALCESENWESGRYFRLDEAAGVMRFAEGWHTGNGPLAEFTENSRGRCFSRGEGLVGAAWASGEALWIPNVQSDPRSSHSPLVEKAGVHSALVLPISIESRVVGVLSMSSGAMRQPDERLLRALRVIGSQIGQLLQRMEAESALSESESRFRQTYELAASGIAHIGIDGRFLRVNRKLCEILGYPEDALIGRSVKDISHPDDRDITDSDRLRVQRGELASARFEKRYIRSDGRVVWVGLTVAIARNSEGGPQYEISIMEDISERKATEAALMRFRTALDSSADMFFLVDMGAGRLLDFNHTACSNLGYERSELLGSTVDRILVLPSLAGLMESYAGLLASSLRADSIVRTYRRKDGSVFEAEVLRRVVESADGPIMVVNSRDLTERRLAEARQATHLRYQERIARFGESALTKREATELGDEAVRTVLEALGGGAVAYVERGAEPQEVVLRALAGSTDAGGELSARYEASGVLGRALAGESVNVDAGDESPLPFPWAKGHASVLLVPVLGDSGARGALCVLGRSGNAFGVEEMRFVMAAATVLSAALQRTDSEGRLAFLAQFDGLTGLPNRALLSDRFSQMIVQARRHGNSLGILFIDLDDFKLVNDSLGHPAGDELLKETARRLLSAIRTGDTVARIAGDEFAIILADLARADDAALVAQKVIERISAPVEVRGQEVFVTASVGVATFPADGDDAETLLGAADAAMYRAKQSGRNAYQFFTSEINQRTRARAQLGSELRRALEREEFMLVYQPKFDLQRAEACGAEALLRWKHPERGIVSPAEFIPVLEESGLIVAVGEWVLRRACADLEDWKASGLPPMPVAVNLSARQFRQQDLDARIRALIAEARVDPALIELEITESQLMQDPDHAIRVMHSLSSAGIGIAIDDFGTGYSSLSYLTRFPVSSLKIDRSFVADVLTDDADGAIVRAIIDMAHTLGFTVVAEGVETEAQAAFLRGLNCEQAQGYLFARPMPAADFKALISSARPKGSRKGRAAARYQ
jgi:diguanylate cyclase (GGDEF)-like protein/PAS domain S-box-containing protein